MKINNNKKLKKDSFETRGIKKNKKNKKMRNNKR